MQGRLLTFRQLRPILEQRFGCHVDSIPPGAGIDADGAPSPPVYAFYRETEGEGVMISTIVVRDDDEPIFPTHLRSFLARLDLTPDDIQPPA